MLNNRSINDFLNILQHYLPDAGLGFQVVPDCQGLELLLIEPGFDVRDLTQHQIERLSDDPPYWIFCWASGRALAQALMDGRVDVRNKVIADFGTGSGIVAIAAKLAGARQVFACDIDEICCQLTRLNAAHNKVDISIVTGLEQIGVPVDMVLAADVLYEKENLRFLDRMLEVADDVIIADSRLKSMPDQRFTHFDTSNTTSFPDYGEAKANNEVKFYCSRGRSGS
ncbi:MAG: methyltransferase [Pseudomonadales bacterium]|nr:methyltransferase [Pseudomonadales bacterium]